MGLPATVSQAGARFLAVDGQGALYFTASNGAYQVTPDGILHTIAGTGQAGFSGDGGPATSALLNSPTGIAVDGVGNVYISDQNNNRIRKVLVTSPALSISGNQVNLSGISHGSQVQACVNVTSPIDGLSYSVAAATSSGGDWLSVNSPQGATPGELTIIADPSTLQPGTYQGTVTLSNPYTSPQVQTISVTLQVGPARPHTWRSARSRSPLHSRVPTISPLLS